VQLLQPVVVQLLRLVTVKLLPKDVAVVMGAAAAVAVAEQEEVEVEGVVSGIWNASAVASSCELIETPVVTERNFRRLFSGVASFLSVWM
jgi:hypothetical protein